MAGKRVAIVQSNYIPWKGYFDLINTVDEFILFDDVQYTIRDWRNRNKIKTAQGVIWLSIPVEVKGRFHQKIREARVSNESWRATHWKSISQAYSKAPYFAHYRERVEALYRSSGSPYLSEINYTFLSTLCSLLGIHTPLTWSSDYDIVPGKTERLLALCQQAGATEYVSGPAAKSYLDETLFAEAGIGVRWMDYTGYPEYHQLSPPFEHAVSVIDLLLNEGPNAWRYMKSRSLGVWERLITESANE
ncbi:MAG: WbqC family protein [Deltaproteobacteria bacterium]|nr:WbqC family protein [Deltaproteobacteria bacterium]